MRSKQMGWNRIEYPKIEVTANNSKRTFTIKKRFEDGAISKYRTLSMPRAEFESCKNNTSNDWANYLRYNSDYYAVK